MAIFFNRRRFLQVVAVPFMQQGANPNLRKNYQDLLNSVDLTVVSKPGQPLGIGSLFYFEKNKVEAIVPSTRECLLGLDDFVVENPDGRVPPILAEVTRSGSWEIKFGVTRTPKIFPNETSEKPSVIESVTASIGMKRTSAVTITPGKATLKGIPREQVANAFRRGFQGGCVQRVAKKGGLRGIYAVLVVDTLAYEIIGDLTLTGDVARKRREATATIAKETNTTSLDPDLTVQLSENSIKIRFDKPQVFAYQSASLKVQAETVSADPLGTRTTQTYSVVRARSEGAVRK
jgi:hypothetical protein